MKFYCMSNLERLIKIHNRVLNKKSEERDRKCNCKKANSCPIDGNFQVKNILYRAAVNLKGYSEKGYIGSTKRPFKQRYYNCRKYATISSYICKVKKEKTYAH